MVKAPPEGSGFDSTLSDGLRIALRRVISEASAGDDRGLDMTGLARSLWPEGFTEPWRVVQGPENHDIVREGREQRMARLGDPGDPRSWGGRSRARVATGVSLTAPGIPMLFMGQEFLEDKPWSDDLAADRNLLLHWAGLDGGDRHMVDHLRCTRDLIRLRSSLPALRGSGFRVVHVHNEDRVLVFHLWVEGEGLDALVIVHLGTLNRFGYHVGFPHGGVWSEVFNSDAYEEWVNPRAVGNGGRVSTHPQPLHGYERAAWLVLPANGLLVFVRSLEAG